MIMQASVVFLVENKTHHGLIADRVELGFSRGIGVGYELLEHFQIKMSGVLCHILLEFIPKVSYKLQSIV